MGVTISASKYISPSYHFMIPSWESVFSPHIWSFKRGLSPHPSLKLQALLCAMLSLPPLQIGGGAEPGEEGLTPRHALPGGEGLGLWGEEGRRFPHLSEHLWFVGASIPCSGHC